MVDLDKAECTCNISQLFQVPCSHVTLGDKPPHVTLDKPPHLNNL